jgi:K+-transporting ATPase ATPase F chain
MRRNTEIFHERSDGVSLLLAVGLFIYLLVALLRADRN